MAISDSIRARYPHEAPQREDFSSEKDYEAALMRYYKGQAELTEGFFTAIPFATVTTLGDGTIAYADTQAQAMLGLTSADLSSHRASDFLFGALGNPIGATIAKRIMDGEILKKEAVYVRRPDGRLEFRLLSIAPVFMPGTRNLARAIGLFEDPSPLERELESLRVLNARLVASLKEKSEEAEENRVLAYTDEMTGLMNRRAFSGYVRPAIEEARRRNTSVSLFLFDPDDFKVLNDKYGHAAGDDLIRELGSRLRIVTESHRGFVARYGGDEFYAFFPGLSRERFETVAAEYAELLNGEYEVVSDKQHGCVVQLELTVSIGGVLRVGAIPDLGQLAAEADAQMYRCKENTKANRGALPYALSFPRTVSSTKLPKL